MWDWNLWSYGDLYCKIQVWIVRKRWVKFKCFSGLFILTWFFKRLQFYEGLVFFFLPFCTTGNKMFFSSSDVDSRASSVRQILEESFLPADSNLWISTFPFEFVQVKNTLLIPIFGWIKISINFTLKIWSKKQKVSESPSDVDLLIIDVLSASRYMSHDLMLASALFLLLLHDKVGGKRWKALIKL